MEPTVNSPDELAHRYGYTWVSIRDKGERIPVFITGGDFEFDEDRGFRLISSITDDVTITYDEVLSYNIDFSLPKLGWFNVPRFSEAIYVERNYRHEYKRGLNTDRLSSSPYYPEDDDGTYGGIIYEIFNPRYLSFDEACKSLETDIRKSVALSHNYVIKQAPTDYKKHVLFIYQTPIGLIKNGSILLDYTYDFLLPELTEFGDVSLRNLTSTATEHVVVNPPSAFIDAWVIIQNA